MNYDYDFFVIGAGSGGVRASRIASSLGAKVAVAEDRHVGGTCVNVGCVPKKLFVYASHFMEEFHQANGYGWKVDGYSFDWQKLLDNKNKEILRLNDIYRGILSRAGVELINARAEVLGPNEVKCGDKTYTAKYILIATGGWPTVPDFPGSEHVISSNEAFFLDDLPKKALVVGGGYIGVEFAGIFNGLGVETTLAYRRDLFLRGFDMSLREYLNRECRKKGLDVRFNTNVSEIVKVDDGLEVTFNDGSKEVFGLVLYATGRHPKTKGLGLEKAGVELNKKGAVIVNDEFQTSCPSIYAVGDVIDRVQLTPVALAEGMFLAHHLFGEEGKQVDYRLIPTAVFSQPELATVGLTEEECEAKYPGDLDIYLSEFRPMKNTLTGSEEKTLMKMIVQKSTDKVLAVHMGGPHAAEIVQGMAVALKAGAKKADFDATIGIHPSSAEEFVTMRK